MFVGGTRPVPFPPPLAGEGQGGSQRGFTLIELLVVLTIMALAMAAVPAIVAGLPGIRLRTAADEMVATLRELHQQAIRRGETTEVILDPAARAYRISTVKRSCTSASPHPNRSATIGSPQIANML